MNTNFGKLKLAAVLSVALLMGAGARAQDAPAPDPAAPAIAPNSRPAPPAATPNPAPPADAKAMPMADKAKMDSMNGMNMSLISLPAPVLENGLCLSRYQKTLVDDIRTRHTAANGGTMAPSEWAILGSYAGDMGANGGAVSPDAQADWEIRSILTPEQRQQAGDGIVAVMVLEQYGIPAPLTGKLDLSADQKRGFAEWGMKKRGDMNLGQMSAKKMPMAPVKPEPGTRTEIAGQERNLRTPPQALKNPILEAPTVLVNDYYNPKAGEYSLTFFEDTEFTPFLMKAGIEGDQALVLKKLTPIQRRMVAEFWWSEQNKEMRQMAMGDTNRM